MARTRETYVCSACGARSPQWRGQCLSCKAWNTLEPFVEPKFSGSRHADAPVAASHPVRLAEVRAGERSAFGTGLATLDRILGKGLVPGGAVLIGGEPGIGKSTLLLQLAGAVAASGRLALYASGEESLSQIRDRGERLGVLHDNLLALSTSRVEDVLALLDGDNAPDLLILDSVQTMTSENAEGLPGNVSQVRAVAQSVVERCKKCDTTVLLVGHVTKDGALAGPRLLEHMVDTVISLEGDRRQMFRLLRVLKNRFGPNQELVVFQMAQRGLEVVEDPSTYFLGARDATLSGTAVVMAVDGQRPLAVEVQALVTRSYLAIPRRTGLGFDVNRLHLLLAVLEKRLHLNFGQVDIYAKIGGGMRLQEPGMDVALVAAVLSSFYDIPLPERAAFWGEVDLNGQIRPVAAHEIRLNQARRLGYTPLLFPSIKHGDGGIGTVAALQGRLFGRRGKSSAASSSGAFPDPFGGGDDSAHP